MNGPEPFTEILWLGAIFAPMAWALVLLAPAWRLAAMRFAPLTALPALWIGLTAESGTVVDLPWVLLGAQAGMDETARIFLVISAALYLLAGVDAHYAARHRRIEYRFFAYYLVAMSGNIGLILARDALSFYTSFALMSFSAFGLVAYSHTPEARRAGRTYIVMVMLSEVLIFSGLLIAVGGGGHAMADLPGQILASPLRDLIILLLLAGFGIKAGIFPLHIWLPISYRAAPLPAAALLSACMSKAGILGWVRCLPFEGAGLPAWGLAMILAGFFSAIYALAAGVNQRDPKSVLAYSSMSKMGVLTAIVGTALAAPAAAPVAWTAMIVYVLHHSLCKAALFLGLGVIHTLPRRKTARALVWVGMLLPALALSGLPLTSGGIAKVAFKHMAREAHLSVAPVVAWLLPLTAVMTALVMARFLWLAWGERHPAAEPTHLSGQVIPWTATVLGVVLLPFLFPDELRALMKGKNLWAATWPFALGATVVVAGRLARCKALPVPCGDLLAAYEALLRSLGSLLPAPAKQWIKREYSTGLSLIHHLTEKLPHPQLARALKHGEERLNESTVFGAVLLLLAAAALLLIGW